MKRPSVKPFALPRPQPLRLDRACRLLLAAAGWLVASGCGPGSGPKIGLRSDDVAGRIPAIKQAAASRDRSAVPALVDHLESDDPAERLYAAEALRRITGQTLGYNYYGTDAERAAAVARWREWLKQAEEPSKP